jgi:hypothetical protein
MKREEKKARVLENARKLAIQLGGSGEIDLSYMLFDTGKYMNGNIGAECVEDLYDSGGPQMYPAFVSPNSGKIVDAFGGIRFPRLSSQEEAEKYFRGIGMNKIYSKSPKMS